MKLEHFALNVADPVAMAAWYVEHLGMTIEHCLAEAPYTHFIADSSGTMMIEIYNNPPDQVPPYAEMDPLLLHFAFVSDDPDADKAPRSSRRRGDAGGRLPFGRRFRTL